MSALVPASGPSPGGPAQTAPSVIANGRPVALGLPCNLHDFLVAQGLLPRSVVVELNGEAVAPSEFKTRSLASGDRLEIVRIVAGG